VNIQSFFPKNLNSKFLKTLKLNKPLILSGVSNTTAKCYLIADLLKEKNVKNIFWVVDNDKAIYDIQKNIPFWFDYPVTSLDNILNSDDGDYRLTEIVSNLHNGDNRVYLTTYKNLHLSIPSYNEVKQNGVVIQNNQEIRIVEIFNKFIQMGYQPSSDILLNKGECRRSGGVLNIYPPNHDSVIKIEVDYDKIVGIWAYDQKNKQLQEQIEKIDILPVKVDVFDSVLLNSFTKDDLVVIDDIDDQEKEIIEFNKVRDLQKLYFTAFPKTDEDFSHLRYLSVLKYYNVFDLLNDLKDKHRRGWKINILTKRTKEITAIFNDENLRYSTENNSEVSINIINADELENIPISFQNPELKIQLLTDKEIFNLNKSSKNISSKNVNLDFLTGLKVGDLIVHMDHGIGRFLGVVGRKIDNIHREYLDIAYAENDKLFIPIDQADKISKYVGGEDNEPRLSRLGAVEWKTATQKIKKETEKIAKELLKLYAKRAKAKGHNYGLDTDEQRRFDSTFQYEETPGQMKAIHDVKIDMETDQPMDRLICGDVGFGKTEVAMRAAFKAVQGGKQVAFVAPITILADQHYKSFIKRAEGFGIKIEALSRFKTLKEQRDVLEKMRKGDVDIVIGTHRLFQPDVEFFNLGLVIIDEEQRFGVKQKDRFKEIRSQIDILTLTATPIPRTLNFALNKLRDISTITTPPPGRLPIVTEVRRYSDGLITQAIQKEVDRGGQVYFLHNRVQTIESVADKYRKIMPHIRFIVAHGQLQPHDLEDRIVKFKNGEYDVLISSTIVENGIDLPSANTLIVDNAENFGLSQLYQLRGRVGRSKTQAYAYFLYKASRLKLDAKKRLKAIVDASELGSGFQIAMRDFEIRGAGDVLGVNQHGAIRVAGVNHFLRMLHKTIEEMKTGSVDSSSKKISDVVIELPFEAYIPDKYIPNTKDKINIYQKLSSVDNLSLLQEFQDDIIAEYGHFEKQVANLFKVLEIKILAKNSGLIGVKSLTKSSAGCEIILQMGSDVTAEPIMNLLKHNSNWLISGDKLKIDIKKLGFNWIETLKINIEKLVIKK